MIEALLWPWINFYFNSGGCVWTMPGPHGKLETAIITQLKFLERSQNKQSKIKLFTVDNKLTANETGIAYAQDNIWKHVVGDAFQVLPAVIQAEHPMFAWFDLCGPLSEKNIMELTKAITHIFSPGSLLFITAQTRGIRTPQIVNSFIYNALNSAEDVAFALNSYIMQTIASKGRSKRLFVCGKNWPYMYSRKNKNYAVFGYGIKSI